MMLNSRRAVISAGLAAATAPLFSIRVRGQPRIVRVGDTAPLAINWPLHIADRKGLYAAEGVAVETTYTNSSPALTQQTIAGSFDIGVSPIDLSIRAILGGGTLAIIGSLCRTYPFSVLVSQSIRKPTDLHGKRLILPPPKSEATIIFYRWLTANGVNLDQVDRVFDPATPNRFAALQSGTVQGAMLTQPFDWYAAERGFRSFFNLAEHARGFVFTTFLARRNWLEKNGEAARGYLRAAAKAIAFLYDPANQEEVIRILRDATRTDAANALRLYDYYTKELRPFDRLLDLPDQMINLAVGVLKEQGDFSGDEASSRFVDTRFLPV